jgi:hypothetical protein
MNGRIEKSLLLSGALCAALLAGCGGSGGSGASGSTAKETPKAPAPAAAPTAVKPPAAKPAEAVKPAPTAAGLVGAAADTAKATSDAALAALQAQLEKIPPQDSFDADAKSTISPTNEDAEFDKLSKEIEKSDGK